MLKPCTPSYKTGDANLSFWGVSASAGDSQRRLAAILRLACLLKAQIWIKVGPKR